MIEITLITFIGIKKPQRMLGKLMIETTKDGSVDAVLQYLILGPVKGQGISFNVHQFP